VNGKRVQTSQAIAVSDAVETIELIVRLPEGFETADGFTQSVTVSSAGHIQSYELPATGTSTLVPVPDAQEIDLTLSIAFCSIEAKEICYVDQTELTFTRSHAQSQQARMNIEYVPEEPS
jgi:hypothetical protein